MKFLQTAMVVPISESIGRAFGGKTLLGTGAAIVAARLVMRSFPGMIALGIVAGGLNYLNKKNSAYTPGKPGPAPHPTAGV